MAKLNASEYAEKWSRRLKASTEDIRKGVQRVTVAPGEAAANQIELMKANLMKSLEDGTWERNVRAVGLDEWKDKFINKGIGRIGAGVDAAQTKQVQMAEKLLANVDASVEVVNRTPRGDLETNIARMTTFAREMNKRKVK